MSYLIKNGCIVTMNKKREVFTGDILVEKNKIVKIAKKIKPSSQTKILDASEKFVLPGFIQTHTHLCQTLFRGLADDLPLIHWLKKKIWPLEASHTPESLSLSAAIGLSEMQLSGTTSILDMGTVYHTDELFRVAKKSKIRYWGGNCLMDLKPYCGSLFRTTSSQINEMQRLKNKWHAPHEGLHFVVSPRFVVSCSERLLNLAIQFQKKHDLLIHTHASETEYEVELIKTRTGRFNVDYLHNIGFLGPKTILVHGVHLKEKEIQQMAKTNTSLIHCPSANLKLGSGFAPIQKYLQAKVNIGLGSDGAACNNSMDPFIELRLAALLQKPLFGPQALPAKQALEMLTINGAKALNMEDKIGSLEVGKKADLITVDRSHPSVATVQDPYSALVYSCLGRDVNDVMIDGHWVVRKKQQQIFDLPSLYRKAKKRILEIT